MNHLKRSISNEEGEGEAEESSESISRVRSENQISKRTHSDNSDSEFVEIRDARTGKFQRRDSEISRNSESSFMKKPQDPILNSSCRDIALSYEALEDVTVYQSDIDAFHRFGQRGLLNLSSVPGYNNSLDHQIRLIRLYKYKRYCRDKRQEEVKLRHMRPGAFEQSWKAMIKLLKRGMGFYEDFCEKKDSQQNLFGSRCSGAIRVIHEATTRRQNFCLVLQEEGNCELCSRAGVPAGNGEESKVELIPPLYTEEERRAINAFKKMLRKRAEAISAAEYSARTPRARRGYPVMGLHYMFPFRNSRNFCP